MTVQPGQSIQSAINNAQAGAVICLAAGTWEENVVIEKSLTLRGAGREQTIIKGQIAGYPVIEIANDSVIEVKIENLTAAEAKGECAAWPFVCPYGILMRGQAKATITDSQILGNGSMASG